MSGKKRILIFGSFPFGGKMGGFAIRYFEFARILRAKGFLVTLFSEDLVSFPGKKGKKYFFGKLREVVNRHEIVIAQPDLVFYYWEFFKTKYLVVDLICPFHVEHQAKIKKNFGDKKLKYEDEGLFLTEMFQKGMELGDVFLCGNEAQRKYYQGMFSGFRDDRDSDPHEQGDLSPFFLLVPFGFPENSPRRKRPRLRGIEFGIGKSDLVFIWFGGLWDWYDPETLLEGFRRFLKVCPCARLVFLSGKLPSLNAHPLCGETLSLSRKLGLLKNNVFFCEDWISYQDRGSYLLEADCAVTSFRPTMETKLSCRTRYADFLWASLPMINSSGDHFSKVLEDRGWGICVKRQTPMDWLKAFKRMEDFDFRLACRKNIRKDRKNHEWSRVMEPLIEFCSAPRKRVGKKIMFSKEQKGLFKEKNAVIFGASKAGLRALVLCKRRGIRIRCFVDNDPDKRGGVIEGKRIYSPDRLQKRDFDLIVVSSFPGREEIEKQCRGMGFAPQEVVWFGDLRKKGDADCRRFSGF